MEPVLNLRVLRQLAWKRGQLLISDPDDKDSWALVVPDNAGKGTDPRGEKAAALAFADGVGMSLQDVDDILHGRVV
jgi:hypothetical protein